MLQVNILGQSQQEEIRSSMETYLENRCGWVSLGYRSSLGAYLQINNVTLEDNLGFNLCVVSTTCYVVIILEYQEIVRERALGILS